MATTNKEERVDLFIPKGFANDDPNYYISVNGVNFVLPKGKTSSVPEYVKYEYDRSMKAQEALDACMDRLQSQANQT